MKKITQVTVLSLMIIFVAGCGNSKKEGSAILTEKKVAFEKLKKERTSIDEEMKKLQEEEKKDQQMPERKFENKTDLFFSQIVFYKIGSKRIIRTGFRN